MRPEASLKLVRLLSRTRAAALTALLRAVPSSLDTEPLFSDRVRTEPLFSARTFSELDRGHSFSCRWKEASLPIELLGCHGGSELGESLRRAARSGGAGQGRGGRGHGARARGRGAGAPGGCAGRTFWRPRRAWAAWRAS